ncbi:MAG: hypothetical protein KGK07_06645 [Chloroflexota bacterium]|nr:hypothetical protein [Chloroflexota bacterium]
MSGFRPCGWKRWRGGQMVLRWTAAGLLAAGQRFRRINGYRSLHVLKRALEQHEEVVASSRRIA